MTPKRGSDMTLVLFACIAYASKDEAWASAYNRHVMIDDPTGIRTPRYWGPQRTQTDVGVHPPVNVLHSP